MKLITLIFKQEIIEKQKLFFAEGSLVSFLWIVRGKSLGIEETFRGNKKKLGILVMYVYVFKLVYFLRYGYESVNVDAVHKCSSK